VRHPVWIQPILLTLLAPAIFYTASHADGAEAFVLYVIGGFALGAAALMVAVNIMDRRLSR
jgi:hypothetical protein